MSSNECENVPQMRLRLLLQLRHASTARPRSRQCATGGHRGADRGTESDAARRGPVLLARNCALLLLRVNLANLARPQRRGGG